MAQSLSIHRVLSFCLVFLFFLAACGKPKTPPPQTSVQTGTEGSSSSDLESAQGSLSVSVFPHADNWAEPAVHGGWVTKNGKTTCLRCHATTQASVEGAPACGSCHILYPHSSGWIKKEVHGGSVLKNGKSACAAQCHGTDLAGGLSKVSCNLCHSIYPHAADFSSPGGHGEVAKEDGKVLCIGCHGEDYQGGGSGVSCFQCHSKYPHAPNWLNPSNHGAEVVANGTVGCATQCHGSDLKGGLSGIACTMCHATFPHADGWENFSGHGQYVTTTLNGSTAECQRCHGTDLNGGGSGVSCSSCHAGYPHSANWGEAAQHGPMAYGNAKTGCATANCHGTAFEG
ncbi:MAG: hypothetical protein U1D33_02400, partial [bacterium]|nr:hypothetical protein [bacterium]